jgi:NADH-quinone oxidoreductase subunit A
LDIEASLFWPLLFFFCCVVTIAAAMITVSFFLGERHKGRVTGEPYESGMPLTDAPQLRVHVKYYLVAMFFVIFDAEALFMFAWALSVRELGLSGYIAFLVFVFVLMIALAYLWKRGALDWTNEKRKARALTRT